MIKRELLLKYARDLAAERANQRPSILAAYLAGSVARGDQLLGDTHDLDLFLVDGAVDAVLPAPEDVQLTPEVVAEITYRRADFYRDTAMLRSHHWLGPEIAEGLALHDPHHYFERVQAGVRGRFDQPVHMHARAQGFLAWARGELARLSAAPDSSPATSFALTLQFAAGAVIALDLAVGSARRLALRLEEAALVFERPDLYEDFLQAMNAGTLTADEAEAFVAIWASLYEAAVEFHQGDWGEDFFVQPIRRNYYESAARALAAEGRGRDAAWLLLYTGAACANQVRLHAPVGAAYLYTEKWERALERLGLKSAEGLAHASGLLRAYVDKVTGFVEQWGEREGA